MRNKNFKLLFISNNYIKYFFAFFIALLAVFFSLNNKTSAYVTLYSQIGSVELGGSLCGGEYSSSNTLPSNFNAGTFHSVTAGLIQPTQGQIASPIAVNGQTTVSQSIPVSSVQSVGVSVPAGFNTGEDLSSVTFVATDRYTGAPLGTVTVPAASCAFNSTTATCNASIPGLSGDVVISSHLDYQRVTTPACGNTITCPTSANVCRSGSCQSVTLNNTGYNGINAETCPVVGTCSSNAECETQIDISALPSSQSVSPGGSVSYAVSVSVGGQPTPLNFTFNCPAGLECRIDAGAVTSGLYAPMRFSDPDDDGNWDGVVDANTGGGLGAAYSSYSTTDWRTGTINFSMYLPESLTLLVRTSGGTAPNTYPISMNAKSPDGYRGGSWYTSPTCAGTCTDTASVDLVVQNPPCSSLITINPGSPVCSNESATGYDTSWPDWSGASAGVFRQVFRAASNAADVNGTCVGYDPINCKDIGLSTGFHDTTFTTSGLLPNTTYTNRTALVCNNGGSNQVKDIAVWTCSTQACNTHNFVSGGLASGHVNSAALGNLTVTTGSQVTVACDFGANPGSGIPSIQFPSGVVNCSWPGIVSGTRYIYHCEAPSSAGAVTVSCNTANVANDYWCPVNGNAGLLTVNGGVCTPNSFDTCASVDGSVCTGQRQCNASGTAWGACNFASTLNSVCDDNNTCTDVGTSRCDNAGSCQTGTASGSHCDTVSNLCVANTTASCSGTSCTTNAECALPVNGVCGSVANGKVYPNGSTGYAPDVQCDAGTSNNTAFPAAGSSVTWKCLGQNGGTDSGNCSASRSAPLPPSPLLTCNTVAGNTSVAFNGSCTLGWNVVGGTADTCVATSSANDWTGNKNVSAGSETVNNLNSPRSYTITCSNVAGSNSSTVNVSVGAAPDFSLAYQNGPMTVQQGSVVTNAIGVSPLNGFNTTVNVTLTGCPINSTCVFADNSSPSIVYDLSAGAAVYKTVIVTAGLAEVPNNYTLIATGVSGALNHPDSRMLTITALGVAPSLTLTASPNPVDYNTPTTLTWSTTGTAPITCNSTAGTWTGSNPRAGSGSVPSTNLTADTTFTMQCTNAYGTSSQSVPVAVRPPSPSGGGGGGGSVCNQISITWAAIGSSVDGYRVYRNSSNSTTTNISGNLTNGTTANSYTDTTAAPSNNYYWVVSYKGALESAPLYITSSPLGATSCNADITGNKDITKVNGTAPSSYLPNAYSTNETPNNVVYNKFDIVTFSVNLPNQAPTGGENANNVIITDTLLNLQKPLAGWNMKIGATTLSARSLTPAQCTDYQTARAALSNNEYGECGTSPNQTLYIKVGNIAQGNVTSVTYNAQVFTTSTQSFSRFKNSVEIDYTSSVSGANLKSLASTPLIVFNASSAPSIIETAP